MLSCDDVRERLAGIETGEVASPEVREHLAACESCRRERAALRADVEGLREGLASLAPSPFLEDAVLAAAREDAGAARRRPWAYVAVGGLAAAALFLAVLLPRLLAPGTGTGPDATEETGGEDDDAGEKGLGKARIAIRPSDATIGAARSKNRARLGALGGETSQTPGAYLFRTVLGSGALWDGEAPGFVRLPGDAVHRYVFGDAEGRAGDRTHTVSSWPLEEGIVLLGTGMLNAIGGRVTSGDVLSVRVGRHRWHTTPGTMEGEITVGAPPADGARARARVLVSTGYSGTLLLEEPLAHALGLHLYEIPGDVRFYDGVDDEGIGPTGRRARARVTLPQLGFDEVVEVQVVPARPWPGDPRSTSEGGPRLFFAGEGPVIAVYGKELRLDGPVDTTTVLDAEVVMEMEGGEVEYLGPDVGPWQFVLEFRQHPGVPFLSDVPILQALRTEDLADLVPRALDFERDTLHRLLVERVTLPGRWEPGATAVIARVWAGRTAIPSREAVVRLEVPEDGTIRFPRIVGEPGATLRMLLTSKKGQATFHDVILDASKLAKPRLIGRLRSTGELTVEGMALTFYEGTWRPDQPGLQDHLVVLQKHLSRRAREDGRVRDDGTSRVELSLRVDREAPWLLVQWILQTCASPDVLIRTIRVGPDDSPTEFVTLQLPLDRDLEELDASAGPDPSEVQVTLQRHDADAPIRVRIRGPARDVRKADWDTREEGHLFGEVVREVAGDAEGLRGLLRTPPPRHIDFRQAWVVLRSFQEAGIDDIRVEGAPAPLR